MDTEDVYGFYMNDTSADLAAVRNDLQASDNYLDLLDVRLECADGYWCHSNQALLRVISVRFRQAIDQYRKLQRKRSLEDSANEEMVLSLPASVMAPELQAIMNFVYTGIVYVSESGVPLFLQACKCLKIIGLKDITLVYSKNKSGRQSSDRYEEMPSKFTEIKERPADAMPPNEMQPIATVANWTSKKANLVKKKYSAMASTSGAKHNLQGRRPQPGSPLITEEFRCGDRYRCKVCHRTYLWKKSLVRHYKDLHPNTVPLVQ